AGCVASWRACAVSPWVLKTITRGYVLQFAPLPPPLSGVIQSVDKHSSSRGGSFRLLQPILLGLKKGRELSANIRSTCVKQSTHAATVQNVDPTQACAVYKAK